MSDHQGLTGPCRNAGEGVQPNSRARGPPGERLPFPNRVQGQLDSQETKTKRHTSLRTKKRWTKVTQVLLHAELNSRENPTGTETSRQQPGLPEGVPGGYGGTGDGGWAQHHAQDAGLGAMPGGSWSWTPGP